MAKAKKAGSRTNSVTAVIALLLGASLVAVSILWLLPALTERGSLSEEALSAERAANNARKDLEKLTSNDSNSANLAAQAAQVDSYFTFFDPQTVKDPVNEVNLTYQELFAAAVAQSGLSPEAVAARFPASASKVSAPAGLGSAQVSVQLVGPPSAPRQLLDALAGQQVLATVAQASVVEATSPIARGGEDESSSRSPRGAESTSAERGNIASAPLLRFDLKLLLWYTTVPPVDLNAGG